MTLALETNTRTIRRAPTDEQIAAVINELEPNPGGIQIAVGLIGGLAVVRSQLESPLLLPAGHQIRGLHASREPRGLHVAMTSRGAGGRGSYDLWVDHDIRYFPEPIVSLLGKISYSQPNFLRVAE